MTVEEVSAYIGIGSNLDRPIEQIKRAVPLLGEFSNSRICGISSLYLSEPVGVGAQADFVNAVVCLNTSLDPIVLLKLLLQLESDFGRVRAPEGGEARTLDLDLLLYGNQVIDTHSLIVPHPRLYQRRFALLPLAELAPGLQIPTYGVIEDLIQDCEVQRVERIED
ncbi:2-amino-4-hydroxy-6-hydroxymethyldihydropteridine diphosphokinase [Pseudomonadota bacterium]